MEGIWGSQVDVRRFVLPPKYQVGEEAAPMKTTFPTSYGGFRTEIRSGPMFVIAYPKAVHQQQCRSVRRLLRQIAEEGSRSKVVESFEQDAARAS